MASDAPAPALPVGDPSLYMVCRMCTRMAEQVEQGRINCHLECGGPRKGMAYPLYRGPLSVSWIRDNCVVCGDPAQKRLEVHGQGEVGVCLHHIALLLPPDVLVTEETETGVVTSTRKRRVSIYEVLGIDPINDLGFTPEQLDPLDRGEAGAGDLHSEGEA